MPSLIGAIIGVASIVVIVLMIVYSDSFSNGNVGSDEDG